MLKAALLILILVLVYRLVVSGQRARRSDARPAASGPEKMVTCAYCHLNVPEGEAVASVGQHYCCDEHRQLGPS